MARAWGDAWADAWGDAWGTAGSTPPPPAPAPAILGGGVVFDPGFEYRRDHLHLSNMTLLATMSALVAAGVLQ